ncbi:MFS transporter, partial [Bacillus cereus]
SLGWLQIIPGIVSIFSTYVSGYIIDKLPDGKERLTGGIACLGIGILLYFMFTAPNVVAFITYQTIISIFIIFVIILLPATLLKNFPSS